LPESILVSIVEHVCRHYSKHRLAVIRSLLLANKRFGTVFCAPSIVALLPHLLLINPSTAPMPLYMQLNLHHILFIVASERPGLNAAMRDELFRLARNPTETNADAEAHHQLIVRAPSLRRLAHRSMHQLSFGLRPNAFADDDDREPNLVPVSVTHLDDALVLAAASLFHDLRPAMLRAIRSESYDGTALYAGLSNDDIDYVLARIGGDTRSRIDGWNSFARALDAYVLEASLPLRHRDCLRLHGPLCFWDLTDLGHNLIDAFDLNFHTLRRFNLHSHFVFCGSGFYHTWNSVSCMCYDSST
jgi:hypothetical protein